MQNEQTILQPPPDAEERLRKGAKGHLEAQKTFAFDKSYWSFDSKDKHFAGQDDLFADLGTPLLDNAFQGYNNCIFAYGQTGAGKSYSMMGYREEPGVIPKICRDMFDRIAELQKDPHLTCTVEVSYLEIYNERVRDLLNPSTKGNLRVREHPSTGPYVEDLAKLVVQSFQEIGNLMDEGNKARTVAATSMNETSSRSHAVFTLTLTQKRHDVETSMDTEKVAKISLVDLAGSERQSATGASGARLKEGAEINRSLSTLGRVIATLAEVSSGKKKNMSMVPYRDSVLTWLLKDSLGGNSMTAMIAAISPADINFEETLSTLRYADSAKRIKNHAVVNEDPNARMIRELKEELAQLRSKLGGGNGGSGAARDIYPPGTPLDQQMVSITQADGSVKQVSKAEIVEQLSQSEKLYKDLNQTWEEKLQMTEEIHKEREAALEELGISIEKGFVGLTTPKKMPHLVNLSDDPLLAECLIYNLKPGTTEVGNLETLTDTEIRLNGSKIQPKHCTFENTDNAVTLVPHEGASVMVNGLRIIQPRRLRSGNRIILGDFHIFRFNNPQEARAERAEQSLLRHSVTVSQIGSPVPSRSIHERSGSKLEFETERDQSRANSPVPVSRLRDSDWSLARREAAGAILGPDQKISHLTDDELDCLFDDVQRVREKRRGRAGSRLVEHEEDSDSQQSYLFRDKDLTGRIFDDFSLDTAITMPETPCSERSPISEVDDGAPNVAREDMQRQKSHPDDEPQEPLCNRPSNGQSDHGLQSEKEKMEEKLRLAKEEFETKLRSQQEAHEAEIQRLRRHDTLSVGSESPQRHRPGKGTDGGDELNASEMAIARTVCHRWRELRYIRIAEACLRSTVLLKEAQILSHLLAKQMGFQFVVLDCGQHKTSSYDLVLRDVSGEDDTWLEEARQPCLAIRVADWKNSTIHLWSLEKLQRRLRRMRQIYQYIDQPEYLQQFRIPDPFTDSGAPKFSFLGSGSVPLAAVFAMRVQDFAVEIISPYTHEALGILKLSLEPSCALGPSKTITFNVVVHSLVGFAEREGTEVHAQLYLSGNTDENGITTTQTISGFDEGPIRFESVHTLSLGHDDSRESILKIAFFARVTWMHLDKLVSWDEMNAATETSIRPPNAHRLPESEFRTEERHDVFARLQILELNEDGRYLPAEVMQSSLLDQGVYQLHQGVQRRISITLTHSRSETLPWDSINSLSVSDIRLLDSSNKIVDMDGSAPSVELKQIHDVIVKDNADGTSQVTALGQWDSSLHNSLLLDRATMEHQRVSMTLRWNILSSRVREPMIFQLDQQLQILPRSYLRPRSILKSFWTQTRTMHSTEGIFSIRLRPVSVQRAADLWRLDTRHDHINGEELLTSWAPRGLSLVREFIGIQRKQQRVAEVEAAKATLSSRYLSGNDVDSAPLRGDPPLEPAQEELLRRFIAIWQTPIQHLSDTISASPTSPGSSLKNVPKPSTPHLLPRSPAGENDQLKPALQRSQSASLSPTPFMATVATVAKNPASFKTGFLLMPSEEQDFRSPTMRWIKRFVDLRPPYLHIHVVPDGDGINAINLTYARIDHDPDFKRLLGGGRGDEDTSPLDQTGDNSASSANRGAATSSAGLTNVFAVYGDQNTFLFAARTETQKVDWILKIDQSYFNNDVYQQS